MKAVVFNTNASFWQKEMINIYFIIYPVCSGMVTQCTRFDKLSANSEARKMDMYIQV